MKLKHLPLFLCNPSLFLSAALYLLLFLRNIQRKSCSVFVCFVLLRQSQRSYVFVIDNQKEERKKKQKNTKKQLKTEERKKNTKKV